MTIRPCTFVVVALASGCYVPLDGARARAAAEFQCPDDRIKAVKRDDLSPSTVDGDACGHAARYTCVRAVAGSDGMTCVREPMN